MKHDALLAPMDIERRSMEIIESELKIGRASCRERVCQLV